MENKLYVGNLAYSVSDQDLRTLFAKAGTVTSAMVIKERDSGRSKGFGFVEMSTAAEAQTAISMFHGQDFQSRPLTVNVARPQEDRPRRSGPGGPGGGGGYQRRDQRGGGGGGGGGYPRRDQRGGGSGGSGGGGERRRREWDD
ncbi:MAG: RNA-binding protein [Caldilineales bacterium]|nr:RNA-binding protein [Caldilineales bacterium]